MPSFPLFTSIKPPTNAGELAYLSDCLDSWRAAGFHPIAVNGPRETETLRKLDLGIEFTRLPSDGRPRIGAIFSAIRENGARFAGIINSDCRIVRYPNLADKLTAGVNLALVLAWRIDLDADLKPTTTQRGGFDAFFFDRNIVPRDDGGFSIAEPWWDHWFPLACAMNGARLETLTVPLLMHKNHPEKWSEQDFIRAGHRFWGTLQRWHQRGDMPKSLSAKMPAGLQSNTLSIEQLGHLTGVTPTWLFRCRPQSIAVMEPEACELETLLRVGSQFLLELQAELARIQAELARTQTELARTQAALGQICNSTCWRMTAPLRRVVIWARETAASLLKRWFNSADGSGHARQPCTCSGCSSRHMSG
jgi:hypothetical protein